jgi:hypothetical protein
LAKVVLPLAIFPHIPTFILHHLWLGVRTLRTLTLSLVKVLDMGYHTYYIFSFP